MTVTAEDGRTTGTYTVRVNGRARGVASASLAGANAWLTLESPVAAGDTVTVAYLGSAMHPLAEATGQVRSGPWEGLAAANVTGIEPPRTLVPIVDPRPGDPLAAVADDALRLDASTLGLTEAWSVARLTTLERLDLSDNPAADLSPLGDVGSLVWLALPGHQVGASVETLGRLTRLGWVWFEGAIGRAGVGDEPFGKRGDGAPDEPVVGAALRRGCAGGEVLNALTPLAFKAYSALSPSIKPVGSTQ